MSRAAPPLVVGYLTVLEHPAHGFFGGFLLICPAGRPLEFQCSAPVRPSRAQEILYGPTLRPYLLGQQIGGLLVANAQLKPQLILTDHPDLIGLRRQIPVPLAVLRAGGSSPCHPAPGDVVGHTFSWKDYELQLAVGYQADYGETVQVLQSIAQTVDLAEPFERIHLAIRDAQRIGGNDGEDEAHARAA